MTSSKRELNRRRPPSTAMQQSGQLSWSTDKLSRPLPRGRGSSWNLRRQIQGPKYFHAHPIFAAVPVLAIGLIWRSTNQEPLTNQKIRRPIDIPGVFAPDPHWL